MANGPMKISDVTELHWKIVIYGGIGAGKTIFANTSKKMRTFVFDVDKGMISVKTHLHKAGRDKDGDHIEFYPIRSIADFDAAFAYMMKNQANYDLIVIDTITELQRIIIAEVCKRTNREVPDQQGWGAIKSICESIILRLRDKVHAHVIILAHEVSKPVYDGGPIVTRPSLQGAFATEYGRQVSVIGRYVKVDKPSKTDPKVMETTRALYFGVNPNVDTKDRSDALGIWQTPDVDALFNTLVSSTGIILPDKELASVEALKGQIVNDG